MSDPTVSGPDEGDFARATAVARRGETNVWDAEIVDGWDIHGNANGGYLLAIAARAMGEAVGRPPVTVTCHYLKPGRPGPVEIEVDTVRAGRRFATVRASMLGGDGTIITLLGTFGDQQPGGPELDTFLEAIDVPPYDECVARPHTAELPAMMSKLDARFHAADVGYQTGDPSGTPEMRGWFAFADGSEIDAYGLLLAADAFAPPIFNTDLPVGWVPTVELTVHVRAQPPRGRSRGASVRSWCRTACSTRRESSSTPPVGWWLRHASSLWCRGADHRVTARWRARTPRASGDRNGS